jgi:hypothetical protein
MFSCVAHQTYTRRSLQEFFILLTSQFTNAGRLLFQIVVDFQICLFVVIISLALQEAQWFAQGSYTFSLLSFPKEDKLVTSEDIKRSMCSLLKKI